VSRVTSTAGLGNPGGSESAGWTGRDGSLGPSLQQDVPARKEQSGLAGGALGGGPLPPQPVASVRTPARHALRTLRSSAALMAYAVPGRRATSSRWALLPTIAGSVSSMRATSISAARRCSSAIRSEISGRIQPGPSMP